MSYRQRVTGIYLLGFFIDLVNMFIANVAYPDIAQQLDVSINQLSWVSNGYLIGLTVVIPMSSWLAKKWGAKYLFMISLVIFITGTSGVTVASGITQLVGWRVVQGLGGGLLIPVGQTLTYALYPSHQRAKLSTIVMLVALMAPALSPAIGGVVVEQLGWRWVFLVSLPLAVITLFLTLVWLKPDEKSKETGALDITGLITGCSALILLLLGLTQLGEKSHFYQGSILFILGLVTMGGYVRSSLVKRAPLLNLRLIREPTLHTAMLIYQLIPGIFTGVNLITILYLQNQLGMPTFRIGALMLPWAIASFFAITLSGKKFSSLGPRPIFIFGCLMQALGIGLLTQVVHPEAIMLSIIAYSLMGFGGSLCSSTAQSVAFINIKNHDLAEASALWNINRQLSFCSGVTLMSVLLNTLQRISFIKPTDAYHLCFTLAALSAVIPILLSLKMNNHKIILNANEENK
ncbi:MFS transporter [Rosenbergiella epipactidis]|uniref:MFS transporter n=1 Tax=Rosenbergiella epipactidis TaxID=1544694 RepID=UPI002025F0A9|nr:MFS transporter [Rosenbergiella epipactidis]MCL9669473.1 MFS transporter [Rosenbergiella epipactidis]